MKLHTLDHAHDHDDSSLAPNVHWHDMGESDHFVQFYENDRTLISAVAGYIGGALKSGEPGIVIATQAHRADLELQLSSEGIDLATAATNRRFFALDAGETLDQLMVDGWPDPERFNATVGGLIAQAGSDGTTIRAFGEMVALLCEEGNPQAAIRLEELWNQLAKQHKFGLFCAYSLGGFQGASHHDAFAEIVATHSAVIPGESYGVLPSVDERLRTITRLQQKAISLEAEVADRRRAEAALEEANRRKDEFLAMLAHELRNPLAPISNAMQLLNRTGVDAAGLEWARDVIGRQVQHLTRLVDDLLDISRITQDKLTLKIEPIEVRALVDRAVEITRPMIDARKHELTISQPGRTLYVEGDLVRLSQAVANLLNNAAKYVPEAGHIRLDVQAEQGQLVIQLTDDGVGIEPDMLPHIFDLFAQGARSLDRSEGGLGVGLTFARKLVELHGGTLEASSAGVGQGSKFEVRLPLLASLNAGSAPAHTVEQPVVASRRVLVVDDVVDSATTLASLLDITGHQAQAVYDGFAALDALAEFEPEIVILDIGLPRMDGYELAGRLRKERPDIRLIALTGYGQAADRERAERAGIDHHLVKPVDFADLEALLAE